MFKRLFLWIILHILICHWQISVVIFRNTGVTWGHSLDLSCNAVPLYDQANEAEEMPSLTMPAQIATQQLVNDLCLARWPWHLTDVFPEEMNPTVTLLDISIVTSVETRLEVVERQWWSTHSSQCRYRHGNRESSFFFCSAFVSLKINAYTKALFCL